LLDSPHLALIRRQLNGVQQNGETNEVQFQVPYPVEKPMSKKARRLTSTPQELLGAVMNNPMDGGGENNNTFSKINFVSSVVYS